MDKKHPSKHHQHGFTLIEILLALAIFAMLASALVPSIVTRAQLRGSYITIQTDVPVWVAEGIARKVPVGIVSGSGPIVTISSEVAVPGQMADIESVRRYVDEREQYIKEEWIPENVKIVDAGNKVIGWWSNYNPYRPGYLYGSRMQTDMVNLKVADEEYELGLTVPASYIIYKTTTPGLKISPI